MGTETIKQVLREMIQDWRSQHRIAGWFLVHPTWAIAAFILLILLSWGLLRAIAQWMQYFWTMVLRSPFILGQGLIQGIIRLWPQLRPPPSQADNTAAQRIQDLIAEIEQTQIEQGQRLLELKQLLEKPPSSLNMTPLNKSSP